MIEFNCPHCENRFRVSQEFAGQHGWCKVCNGLIFIPGNGDDDPNTRMSPQQKVDYLSHCLRSMSTRYAKGMTNIARTTRRLEELQGEINELTSIKLKYRNIESRLEESEALNARLSQEITSLAENRGRADERIEWQSVEITRLTAETETLRRAYAERERELKNDITDLRATAAAMSPSRGGDESAPAEVARLSQALAVEKERADAAETRIREAASQAVAHEHDLAHAQEVIKDLREKVELLTKAEVNYGVAKKMLDDSDARIEEAKAGQQRAFDSLQQAQAAAERAALEAAAYHEQAIAAARETSELREKLTAAAREAALLDTYRTERDRAVERVHKLEVELDAVRQDLSLLRAQAAAAQSTNSFDRDDAEALAELERERSARAQLESTLERLRADSVRHEVKAAALEAEMRQLNAHHSDNGRAEEELRRITAKLDESQTHVIALTAELSKLSHAMAAMEQREAQIAASNVRRDEEPQKPPPSVPSDEDEFADADELGENEGITLSPEILDDDLDMDNDAMVDALFRFIRPEAPDRG